VGALATLFSERAMFAGQGVARMLYTSPNMQFIESTSGEVVVNVNDASGSVSTLQSEINNARAANPTNVIVIRLTNATYLVSSGGIVLGSHECLVASGATIQAANASVTASLITIATGSTNVSVAGGMLDGSGANIQGIYAPAAARVNIDKVTVRNCGLDCILLKGYGNSTYDNEMTVTRCDSSGSPLHAGISIQNCTQAVVTDNNCHNSLDGIYVSCGWATVANNTCAKNVTGIEIAGGNDNVVANNTCNNNGTGIRAGASNNMIVSNATGTNSTAGINSNGSGNTFVDNLFLPGNAANFTSSGSGNRVVAYKTPLNASGQDYFYPPLIDDQHATTIVGGMGRTDLTISSTTIADVQNQYDSALGANPNNVIVLHLNGAFTVGSAPLTLESNTCVLLNGTIQINSSTTASSAISGGTAPRHVSISGGIIDGGNLTGNNGIQISGASMLQVDSVTLQNFGLDNPRAGGSDVIHLDHGSTPDIVTRCTINGGSARGIWLQLSGVKSVMSDNEVTSVNQDGVDCDSSTSGCVAKFNYCHDLVRYGVFFEQSASHNLALGNICNNDGRDINVYNNSATPRGDTAFNSIVCNSLMGNNGLRNGSTGTNIVQSSHNFFFNNSVINASISSETYGTENYYSQNYLAGGTLSTAGVESFFNSTDVSSNLFIQASDTGPAVQAQNAATTNNTPIISGPAGTLANDQWQLVPTDSGFYRLMNLRSHLAMNVSGASLNPGARVIQWPFGSGKNDQWMPRPAGNGLYYFVNRLSGLCLDIPAAVSAVQLDQQPYMGVVNQQFSLNLLSVQRQPWIASIADSGSQFIVSGSNGVANWPYLVLASTNVGVPAASWNADATNVFDAGGNFIFTNAPGGSAQQLFYLLRVQ
jgi:parallel beta-helix repeat protein